MTAEESLSVAVRGHLSGAGAMSEVRMFGGTGFMLNGNMVAAVSKRGLLLRVGKDRYRDALAWPGARPMEMRGRTMEGYVYIDPPVPTNDALKAWLDGRRIREELASEGRRRQTKEAQRFDGTVNVTGLSPLIGEKKPRFGDRLRGHDVW
jgi:TfoX/Sxy family transcriptional regulator of competence genes